MTGRLVALEAGAAYLAELNPNEHVATAVAAIRAEWAEELDGLEDAFAEHVLAARHLPTGQDIAAHVAAGVHQLANGLLELGALVGADVLARTFVDVVAFTAQLEKLGDASLVDEPDPSPG